MALDTLRTLRHEGFVVTGVTVGAVRIDVAPVPLQSRPLTMSDLPPSPTYLDEYASPAIRSVITGSGVEPDENGMVPA